MYYYWITHPYLRGSPVMGKLKKFAIVFSPFELITQLYYLYYPVLSSEMMNKRGNYFNKLWPLPLPSS